MTFHGFARYRTRSLDQLARRRRGHIARVRRPAGLDQQQMNLLLRHRPMLHPLGNDEQLSRPELDLAVAKLDRKATLENEEEVVRVGVGVPNELALNLDDHDV